ncbi:MAG: hypothetical protein EXS05_22310 [Planctomycetaceae bacterium]|nr:hypothetical protein [Planctomycetaceae bacterium]
MFFRFGTALALAVLISLAGTALEKRSLELKRAVSQQQYQLEILEERYVTQRTLAQRQGAPSRLIDQLDPELLAPPQPEKPAQANRKANRPKPKISPAPRRTSR